MRPVIYILDDDLVFARLLKANLGQIGEFRLQIFTNPAECLDAIAEAPPHILITDLYMESLNGVEISRQVRESHPHLPIFVLTARGEMTSAIEAMKAGASEYLLKPVNVTELATLVRNAMRVRPLLEEAVVGRQKQHRSFSVEAILGEHPLVEETRDFIRTVGPARRVGVLLLGESGVGKNLAAQAIHLADTGKEGQFVELNCSALPATLLEAELFGYMKGAFTDARENKPGLVEIAHGGTLFLDEIGEMPMPLQTKLLNFLESRRFRRLGGTREREVDVRVIAATNRPVDQLTGGGSFRDDLFYRISAASHTLPPLREIRSDIPLIAGHFAETIARELGKDFQKISGAAEGMLSQWSWPGNVRELRNVIERALIFSTSPVLGTDDLPPLDRRQPEPGKPLTFGIPAGLSLRDVEKEYILRTLEEREGRIQETADVLGISRKNLWEKRRRYGLN